MTDETLEQRAMRIAQEVDALQWDNSENSLIDDKWIIEFASRLEAEFASKCIDICIAESAETRRKHDQATDATSRAICASAGMAAIRIKRAIEEFAGRQEQPGNGDYGLTGSAASPANLEPVAWMWDTGDLCTLYERSEVDDFAKTLMHPLYALPPGYVVVPISLLHSIEEKWSAVCARYDLAGSDWHKRMPGDWPVEVTITVDELRKLAALNALKGTT